MERWTDYYETIADGLRRMAVTDRSGAALSAADAVTLTGMDRGNRARTLGDLNFHVPLSRYGWTESAHQVILHYWFDQYLCEHRQGAL